MQYGRASKANLDSSDQVGVSSPERSLFLLVASGFWWKQTLQMAFGAGVIRADDLVW